MKATPDPTKLQQVNAEGGRVGFVLRSTVREAGLADSTWEANAHKVGWANLRRDLWVPPGVVLSHEQRARAELLVVKRAVITGASALHLAEIVTKAPEHVELLYDARCTPAVSKGVCIHRTARFDHRTRRFAGLECARLPRCFADYAQHAEYEQYCRDIVTAMRKRLCTLDLLDRELAVRKRFPGRALMRQALAALRSDVAHSKTERLARRRLNGLPLAAWKRPYTVEVRSKAIAEIDIAFEPILYGVEVDGPHHLIPQVAAADRDRDRRLGRIGWTIDRFFWFEIEDRGDWFRSQVARRIAELTA